MKLDLFVVSQLVAHMQACQRRGVSFAGCLAEARKQYQREVKERADRTPLEEPGL